MGSRSSFDRKSSDNRRNHGNHAIIGQAETYSETSGELTETTTSMSDGNIRLDIHIKT